MKKKFQDSRLAIYKKQNKSFKSNFKICFIALGAYPLLTKKTPKVVVGPDVHYIILAKEFVKRGVQVSLITQNTESSSVEYIDGIEVINVCSSFSSLRKLSKAFYLLKAIVKADAHVYVHCENFFVSFCCHLFGRKSIYEIASNALVLREIIDPENKEFHRPQFSLTELFHQLDIILADSIVVQNKFQKILLKQNYSKDSNLVKLSFPLSTTINLEKAKQSIVLWVGAIADVKQPHLFLKLSENMSEVRFQMIGGCSDGNKDLYEQIKRDSQKIPNLEFLGPVSFNDIDKYFKQASILVNTSKFEGFPHAFLQAWMYYCPVVSLNADPDEIICKNKIGFHTKTFDGLINSVKLLLNDKKLCEHMGKTARQYVEREHDIANAIEAYCKMFTSLVSNSVN